MEKIVKVVDKERGICQVTVADSRWYGMVEINTETGLPGYSWVPSVTWVASYFPKGFAYLRWLAEKGWTEAEAIKNEAAGKGSKVHQAVALLLDGHTVSMEDALPNPETGQAEPLTLPEWEAILSFSEFHKKYRPRLIARDFVVWNKEHGFAGTADVLWEILPEFADKAVPAGVRLDDFKTSKAVWPAHRIQVSAYRRTPEVEGLMKKAGVPEIRLGILQLGYKLNKAGWKLTDVPDQFDLFLATRAIWKSETEGQSPLQRDLPISIKLEEKKPEPKTAQEAQVVATD